MTAESYTAHVVGVITAVEQGHLTHLVSVTDHDHISGLVTLIDAESNVTAGDHVTITFGVEA